MPGIVHVLSVVISSVGPEWAREIVGSHLADPARQAASPEPDRTMGKLAADFGVS